MQWEVRKREWETERARETRRAAEDKLRIVGEWEACLKASEALHAEHVALATENCELYRKMERICEIHDRMESNRAKIAANEAKIAAYEDRKRVLWLRGILCCCCGARTLRKILSPGITVLRIFVLCANEFE